jgi:hypothetical protein
MLRKLGDPNFARLVDNKACFSTCDRVSLKGLGMSTVKEQITELVWKQPDDSSYDEIIRELAFDLMVQRGLKDSDEGRTITNEEMHRRIKSWQN